MLRDMTTPFGKNVQINEDGTALTTEQRLQLALLDPENPNALKQGTVRNITQNRIRSAMAELAHGQIDKVAGWIQQTAEGVKSADGTYLTRPDPAKAVELFLASAEFSLPKMKAVAIDVRNDKGDVKTYSIHDLDSIVSEQ